MVTELETVRPLQINRNDLQNQFILGLPGYSLMHVVRLHGHIQIVGRFSSTPCYFMWIQELVAFS